MITRIGIVSGELLNLLDDLRRPLLVDEISFYTGEPKELVLMAIGWLARNGLVHVEQTQADEYAVYGTQYFETAASLNRMNNSRLRVDEQ